jgi:drug/metabolite transporter (DMT)-like permease
VNAAQKRWQAVLVLSLCSVVTGASFVLTKGSMQVQLPLVAGESTWFVAAQNMVPRFAIGVAMLVGLHGFGVLRLTAREWAQAAFMAVCSAGGCLFQTDGMQFSTASVTAFVTQFYVILIPVWTALAHRRLPGLTVWVAGVLVLAGVAVLAQLDWQTFRVGRGEAEVLIAAVFFSLLIVALTWEGCAGNRPERAVAGMFALEAAMFFALSLAWHRDGASLLRPLASPAWLWLVGTAAVIGTAGPFIVMSRWQRFVGATEAALIYSLTPVFSAVSGLFLPALIAGWTGIAYANEIATRSLVIGGALILAANALIQLRPAPKAG